MHFHCLRRDQKCRLRQWQNMITCRVVMGMDACGLAISNTPITSLFSTFDLTLKILCYSGYSEIDCYCGTDPVMPAC